MSTEILQGRKLLEADRKAFADRKSECNRKNVSYWPRKKAISLELDAVQKALDILESPEAKRSFQRAKLAPKGSESPNPQATSFLQLESLAQVSEHFSEADPFAKVKDMIQEMIAKLSRQLAK